MTPAELERLHGAAMAPQRAWSKTEFADLLADPSVHLVHEASGLALYRTVADEAELLTLAVHPEARRRGVGGALLQRVEADLQDSGVQAVFLEVSAHNSPAIGLYSGRGYAEIGRRPRYYALANGNRADALVMSKNLTG